MRLRGGRRRPRVADKFLLEQRVAECLQPALDALDALHERDQHAAYVLVRTRERAQLVFAETGVLFQSLHALLERAQRFSLPAGAVRVRSC